MIAKGGNEDTYMIGRVAVAEIQNLIVAYKERFDKSNFIQNLILDNLLLVDVYNRAKKLHIPVEAKRVVILVEIRNEKDQDAIEILKICLFQEAMILLRQLMRKILLLCVIWKRATIMNPSKRLQE